MRYFSLFALGVAVIVGCAPNKEMPETLPTITIETPDPNGTPPATSEPAAKAIIERAVKAIGENVPGGIARTKVCTCILKGKVFLPNEALPLEATRRFDAVWPDKAHVAYIYKDNKLPDQILRLQRPLGWMTVGGKSQPTANAADAGKLLFTDIVAQYWVPLGQVFTDARVIVYDVQKVADMEPRATSIKIVFPELPVYLVAFDDASGLPVRVECHPMLGGQRVREVFTMTGHRPAGGFMLPTVMKYTQRSREAEEWTVEKWEFPEKHDEALFAAPKE